MYEAKPYEHDHESEVTLFAETNYRNVRRKFGIRTDDRRRHMYIIGKTGMGKTTLLENMVLSDIYAGHGVAYIDPHGDTAQKILDFIPANRINDVVYFNPADMDNPVGFNILEIVNDSQKHLVAAGLMGVFKKIWPDVWSPRMEYILLNTILALIDAPGSTLLGISRILVDEEYRKRVVSLCQDPVVKTFWVKEFASFSEKYRTEAVAPVQNKVGQFLSASIIRNIVAQVKSTINMREIMDSRKILIVNLAKGLIGEENARLLGGMIITRLQLSVMERADMPETDRQDFYLYVDEFQNFATESFANILSEARKYRLNLIVAHQYIEQLGDTGLAEAIFGNVGTIISFRVGANDAEQLAKEFAPRFTEEDLVNLGKYDVYLRLMINGAASPPFSATTLLPIAESTGSTEKVVRVSRERYARPRAQIEEKVLRWSGMGTVDEGGMLMTEEESEAKEMEEKFKELEASSPKIPELAKVGGAKKDKPTFKIPCSVCGKIQELTFEPDWSRPWFCKEDLEKKKAGLLKNIPTVGPGRPPGLPPKDPPAPSAPAAAVRPPLPPPPPAAAVIEPPAPAVSLSSLFGKRLDEEQGEVIEEEGATDDVSEEKEKVPPLTPRPGSGAALVSMDEARSPRPSPSIAPRSAPVASAPRPFARQNQPRPNGPTARHQPPRPPMAGNRLPGKPMPQALAQRPKPMPPAPVKSVGLAALANAPRAEKNGPVQKRPLESVPPRPSVASEKAEPVSAMPAAPPMVPPPPMTTPKNAASSEQVPPAAPPAAPTPMKPGEVIKF
ncbi:MAG: type IV secretion system DNA-binding domain-containing protein [Patescibacteria group bacterium]|nr:type IV secretion system DNA-binding domain-containing protein [Patescibacteria group bacterium]